MNAYLLLNADTDKLNASQYTTERSANYRADTHTCVNDEHQLDEKKDSETDFESAPEYSNEKDTAN
jgi:hypothetical protein